MTVGSRALATFALAFSVACGRSPDAGAPRLVVLIGIDQLRADYLERYDEVFQGGFRRLRDQGWRVDRAWVDHAPTLSWPGHTTLATGAHPKTHGINANDWIELMENGGVRRVLPLLDPDQAVLGYPEQAAFSPRNIRVTGLADWFRAAHPEARAVALSTGPALAVAYGGLARGPRAESHVYWLSAGLGRFITSTYYRDEYPSWVQRFNDEQLPRFKEQRIWSNAVPEAQRHLARVDAKPYEGDGVHTTFPHRFDDEVGDSARFNRWFYNYSPGQNEALFALAREAVRALALGQDDIADLLAIAVKSVDRVGHDYGPHSMEQLDNLVRIDRELGAFLEFLDGSVGRGRYVVAVSADHGAPNIVEYELEEGRVARRIGDEEVERLLARLAGVADGYAGPEAELPALVARELEQEDFVARAMTAEELAGSEPADEILQAYRNSYVPGHTTTYPLWTREMISTGRVDHRHPAMFGVIVEYVENYGLWSARSTHGSAYRYDREVPLLLLGAGIEAGVSSLPARTVDVAPTLAYLAGVSFPESVDGQVLRFR
jgi:arylsulfatase A-like enzyme